MCYLVRGPQGLEERQAHALAALKDGWAAELRRQRESWAAAERSRREQWMQGKTAEVKQLTVKGLEVEVRHICMHTHTHTHSLTHLLPGCHNLALLQTSDCLPNI